MRPGVYYNMTGEEYRGIEALNAGKYLPLSKSPAHCQVPAEETPAMRFGAAYHCAILEPHRYAGDYAVAPKIDKRTKAGKLVWAQWQEENDGKAVISQEDADTIGSMAEVLKSHETASLLLSRGQKEVSLFWQCPHTGILCKARLDSWDGENAIIPDLKTSNNAAPQAFQKSVANYFYHLQAAHYLEGIIELTDTGHSWTWIVQEKNAPYAVAVYEPDAEMLYVAREMMRPLRDLYAQCLRSGVWPGYSEGIKEVSLPRWAIQNI